MLKNNIEIDIVPIDFVYTSCIMSNIRPFTLSGIMAAKIPNKVFLSNPKNCTTVNNIIINGINDKIMKYEHCAAYSLIFASSIVSKNSFIFSFIVSHLNCFS